MTTKVCTIAFCLFFAYFLAICHRAALRVSLFDDSLSKPLAAISPPSKENTTVDLSGTLIDAAGAPVQGAIVSLVNTEHSATTDSAGTFRISGQTTVAAGKDVLLVAIDSNPAAKFHLPGHKYSLGILRVPPPMVKDSLVLDIGRGTLMLFNRIEAGSFLMGSPPAEAGHGAFFKDPETVHKVTITRPYYLGVYEVTQGQYRKVMGCNPSGNYPGDKGPPPPVTNIGDDLPVNHVNFIQARNFALRISQITGRKVRLPTEAEWEMACRAGTQTAYYYGNEVAKLSSYAWYGEGSRISHPCGMKLPNACGLYDILGNVWELASDYYETWSTNDPKVDPTGPATGFRRVLRGGCSYNPWDQIRCAMRHPIEETYSDPAIGMRLLCEVD